MAKAGLVIALILTLIVSGCSINKHISDTSVSDKEIYEFMKFAIADLKIADSVKIIEQPVSMFVPIDGFNHINIDQFVIEDETDIQPPVQEVIFAADTTFIKNQNKRIYNGFKWNLKKLGFKKNQNPMEIFLSLPLFSRDKKTVLVFKRYNNRAAFMAGGSQIKAYTKKDDGWQSKNIWSALN